MAGAAPAEHLCSLVLELLINGEKVLDFAHVLARGEQQREVFRHVRDDISRKVVEFSRRLEPQLQGATGERSP